LDRLQRAGREARLEETTNKQTNLLELWNEDFTGLSYIQGNIQHDINPLRTKRISAI